MKKKGYYNSLDENFNMAYELIIQNQCHTELVKMLKSGNIVEKHLASLKIESVKNTVEAQILIDNLTGQDGKIREVVSFKIAEFTKTPKTAELFCAETNYKTFLNSIIDINGNVCRNIISAALNLKSNKHFCKMFCDELVKRTYELANIVKDFDFQDGKYKVNKEVFKLYWYLETISVFIDFSDMTELKKILNITKSINEYTIREKTAKILSNNFDDTELMGIRELLKNDTNYYVRRF